MLRWIVPLGACVLLVQQPPAPPVFRSTTVLVPVDVRVIDRDGNPVTDLRQADFTLLEEGTVQEIAQFSTYAFDPSLVAAAGPEATSALPDAARLVSNHRTFVFVLGRGRLRGPAKGLEALIEFARNGVRPTDRLAVVAYDRITHMTSDAESVIRLLQRYAEEHERLEALLDHWFDQPLSSYLGADPPPNLQRRIDDLLRGPGLPSSRHLLSMPPELEDQLARDRRTALDADQNGTNDFVAFASAAQDIEKLHATIDYLRLLEGEKHVIFVTEEGLHGASNNAVYGEKIARLAAGARVTVSTIHTAGLPLTFNGVSFDGPSWSQRWAYADSRSIAQRTGGMASVFDYAARALDRLERATRFTYLLGYRPKHATWDGRPRRIEVKVNRRNVSVMYRNEYYARQETRPYDHQTLLTEARISGARDYRRPVADIGVRASATLKAQPGAKSTVHVQLSIDAADINFAADGGRHVGSLEVALFVGSAAQRQIGSMRKRIDLRLTAANFEALRRDGITFEAVVETEGAGKYLKAVVYDYASDRVGSTFADVKK